MGPTICGVCAFYSSRHADEAAQARAAAAGNPHPAGQCRRYPAVELKNIDDWCGEFSAMPEAGQDAR